MPPRRDEPGSLARRMREMREAAGLQGTELANRLGWYREKVSRIENGQRPPTRTDITEWVSACGQPGEVALDLLAMLPEALSTHRLWRDKLRQGSAQMQRNWDTRVREARLIRNFEIVVVPGLLQTAGYARYRVLEAIRNYGATLTEEGIEAAVAAKTRRQEVLYDPARRFEFVMTQAALMVGACPPDIMVGQIDRISQLAQLSNIIVGIIPLRTQLSAMPQNPFIVLDNEVSAETHGSEVLPGQEEAQTYLRLADNLLAEAATGEEAQRLLADTIAWWRNDPSW